jgi:hypothetical protein
MTVWVTSGGAYADGETGTEYITSFGVMAENEGVAPAPSGGYQMLIQWLAVAWLAGEILDRSVS